MPFLALTRAGVASLVKNSRSSAPLWIGSETLSCIEVQKLRASGMEISVFVHAVRTEEEIQDATSTLREHHPNEAIWVESAPDFYARRSSDIGQAFLRQEFIVGVNHRHNEYVGVASGQHAGERGSLVSLISLEPEPEFILEAESGQDIPVRQYSLVR